MCIVRRLPDERWSPAYVLWQCPRVCQRWLIWDSDPSTNSTDSNQDRHYLALLRRCANIADLSALHARIAATFPSLGILLSNTLVEMYGKCGDADAARLVFEKMAERNCFSWNAMIAGYAQSGHHAQALEIARKMVREGLRPDRVTCVSVLDALGCMGDLDAGRRFHRGVCEESGFGSDVVAGTAAVTMYSRCGSVGIARLVFDEMPVRNVVSWSAMIAAYAQRGHPRDAVALFVRMEHEGVRPNAVTLVSVLDACASSADLARGRAIHDRAASAGLDRRDVILANTLVHMYGRCGDAARARAVFEAMDARSAVSWNAMIAAAAAAGERCEEACALVARMDLEGVGATKVTFVSAIDACAGGASRELGGEMAAAAAAAGLERDAEVGNAIVHWHGRCGDLAAACDALERIRAPDAISFATLLAAYAQHGRGRDALRIGRRMDLHGVRLDASAFVNLLDSCASIATGSAGSSSQESARALALGEDLHDRITQCGIGPDTVLQTALVDMYGKCGNPDAARRAFDRLGASRAASPAVWNALLAAYVLRYQGKEALLVAHAMSLAGVKPDSVTFLALFAACASVAALARGRLEHARLLDTGVEQRSLADAVLLSTAAISMYAKCGSLRDAEAEFARAARLRHLDVVSWSAMLAAYCQFGQSEAALRCFRRMQQLGVPPDAVSFVSVISGCSSAGLVSDAIAAFTSLQPDHGIAPTNAHFGCLVDLLSRAGWLAEAEAMVRRRPFHASHSSWMTLLGACRSYGDLARARRVATRLAHLKPRLGSPYALLANLFCLTRRWDDVKSPPQRLLERGFVTQPGCSWIELHGRVYEFFLADAPLPREEEIFAELERLWVELRKVGYERDPIKRVHDHGEQEKKFLLGYHSEKLAVIFGTLSTAPGTPLRVVKNVRICCDCHEVIKCISKLQDREITLRDDRNFHQFRDGFCSCNDRF